MNSQPNPNINDKHNLRYVKYADMISSVYDKPGQNPSWLGRFIIVKTVSGNSYGIGAGVIINGNQQESSKFDGGSKIIIGEPWHIRNFYSTTPVSDVEFDNTDWHRGLDRTKVEMQTVDSISPFVSLARNILKEREYIDLSERHLIIDRTTNGLIQERNEIANQYGEIPSWH